MLSKVKEYNKLNKMVEEGDRIVIGVSGGADSVCLLYVLKELCQEVGASLFAVHVNHGIRGNTAKQDEEFVKELCSSLNIHLHVAQYEVKKIAKMERLSEEEAGRKVRYQTFIRECENNRCNKIAIAHNMNDNAETMLFHLFRGSGITGLTGIASTRELSAYLYNITIIRPLLCITRKEIEHFLEERRIPYQVDETNLTDDYSRNKIRNQVLTYVVRELNPNAIEHIAQSAYQLKEIEDYLKHMVNYAVISLVEATEHSYRINLAKLQKEHVVIQKELIRRILEKIGGGLKDIEAKHIYQVLSLRDKQVGKRMDLPYHIRVEREYEYLKFYSVLNEDTLTDEGNAFPTRVMSSGTYPLISVKKMLEVDIFDYEKSMFYPKNKYTKWFDYDKIENTVEIRTKKERDYIQINDSGGRKKLKNYFIDQKVPVKERKEILLVADGDHVMWIMDGKERMSEKYKVNENTRKVLSMSLRNMEEMKND